MRTLSGVVTTLVQHRIKLRMHEARSMGAAGRYKAILSDSTCT